MTANGGRRSKGRQKIEIKRIEKEAARQVCFSKRRAGLFKKANELSVLCGVEVAVVAFSPAGKPFSFGHPSVDAVIHRFASGGVLPRRAPEESSGPMLMAREFGSELARLEAVLQGRRRRKQELEEAIAAVLGGDGGEASLWDGRLDGSLRVGLERVQADVLRRLHQLAMEDQARSSNMAMDAAAFVASGGGIGGYQSAMEDQASSLKMAMDAVSFVAAGGDIGGYQSTMVDQASSSIMAMDAAAFVAAGGGIGGYQSAMEDQASNSNMAMDAAAFAAAGGSIGGYQPAMEDKASSSNTAMDAAAFAAVGGGIGGLCAGYGHAVMDYRILTTPASYEFGQVLGFGQGFGCGNGFF